MAIKTAFAILVLSLTACTRTNPTPPTPPAPTPGTMTGEQRVMKSLEILAETNKAATETTIAFNRQGILSRDHTALVLDYTEGIARFQKAAAAAVNSTNSRDVKLAAIRRLLSDLKLDDRLSEFIRSAPASGGSSAVTKALTAVQLLLQLLQSEVATNLLFGMSETGLEGFWVYEGKSDCIHCFGGNNYDARQTHQRSFYKSTDGLLPIYHSIIRWQPVSSYQEAAQ